MNILSQEFTDDFFGIFQVDIDCESYINYFNHLYDSGFIVSRATSDRNDKQFFLHENMIMEFSTNPAKNDSSNNVSRGWIILIVANGPT